MSQPVLWHLSISPYSEKVRWALDHKDVPHERRLVPGGMQTPLAVWVSRGRSYTLPAFDLDGRRLGDSTAIIAALEERFPARPLYPDDPGLRRRALALEDFFDEQLGPYARNLVFHEAAKDPASFDALVRLAAPTLHGALGPFAVGYARVFLTLRYRSHPEAAAQEARERIVAAFDRLEEELAGRPYLVGDTFTVADLTAATMFYALVLPPLAPQVAEASPPAFEAFRLTQRDRPGYRWVERIYAEHRRPAARVASPA
jgi:glutathione S-transferase